MNGKRFAMVAGFVLAAKTSWAQVGPDTAFILRSTEELSSLRAVLTDEDSWTILQRAAKKYAVWRIVTEAEASPPEDGEDGERSWLHHFDLAGRRGRSSKLYRLSFRVRDTEPGDYETTPLPERFVPRGEPFEHGVTLGHFAEVAVFRSLLADAEVLRQLTLGLDGRQIVSFRLRPDAVPPDIWEERRYHATFSLSEIDGEETLQLEYEVLYDPRSQRVIRILIKQKTVGQTAPRKSRESGGK